MAQPKELVAFDKETDLRIQRMSVQKVAVDAMGLFPVTSKGEAAASADKWKEVFVGCVTSWLTMWKLRAGRLQLLLNLLQLHPMGMETSPKLDDEAIRLTEQVQEKSAGNDVLKNAIKLQFVKFGIKPGPLPTVISQLTKSQAKELVDLINKEV
jgi:hypothetical protein